MPHHTTSLVHNAKTPTPQVLQSLSQNQATQLTLGS